MTDARHQERIAMVKEDTLECKRMELEEGRSQWWKEDISIKDIKLTRSRWWRSNVCSIICVTLPLFLILMVLASLKFNKQDSMMKELKTKADNMASTLHSFLSNLQQTAPHSQPDYKELTEVKSEVTNLSASIALLSSKLHGSDEKVKTILSNLTAAMSIKGSEDEKLVTTVANLTSEIMNIKHSKVENEGSRMTALERSVTNLTHSVNALSSGLQNTVQQLDQKWKMLETTINSMLSSLDMIPTLQQIDEKLATTLTNLTAEMISIKSAKDEKLMTVLTNLTTEIMNIKHSKDEKILTTLTNLTAEIMNIKRTKEKISYVCKENWRLHATSCYLFSSNKLSWYKARDYCSTQGASLLIMNSADEWQFIKSNSESQTYWIGLTDELTGLWRWVDGTNYVMDKSQWDVGQPDDWKGHGLEGGEDCGQIIWNTKLNDDHCRSEHRYICERSATAD